jgi:enamine deaminase RidA (YjgF/YER057c/UK114 family)
MSAGRRATASNPPGVPAPIRPYYSNCVRVSAGPLLFVAGQVGLAADGRLAGPGAAEQAEQALRNIALILGAHGATMGDVVKVVVYVTDMKYLDEITPVRLRYFPSDGPASTIVAVSALAFPELRVEIEAVATAP